MDPILLTIPQAAAAIGIGRSHIYQMLARGQLEAVKVGRRRLIIAQSVKDFVASLRQSV